MKRVVILLLFVLFAHFINDAHWLEQKENIYVYHNSPSSYHSFLTKTFDSHGIIYQETKSIDKKAQGIYVIFDAHSMHPSELPKHYIVYQNIDLTANALTPEYNTILKNAVAIWDYSLQNIARYSGTIKNYYYLPIDFEYTNPIILSCFLPTNALDFYKELVSYSNTLNNAINSHVPTIFCYAVHQAPENILELGVGHGGDSTKALFRAAGLFNGWLTGLDIIPFCEGIYKPLSNTTFHLGDDITFLKSYAQQPKRGKFDIVFIDTSHRYEHTLEEIKGSIPVLKKGGIILFHDSNVHPLNNNTAYLCLNQTIGQARGNPRGVSQALKEYFYDFDEYSCCDVQFTKDGISWRLIHYPFCNGLTILKKQ